MPVPPETQRVFGVPSILRDKLAVATLEYHQHTTEQEGENLSTVRFCRHAPEGKGVQALLVTAPDDRDALELLDDIQRIIDAYLQHKAAWEALQDNFRRAKTKR